MRKIIDAQNMTNVTHKLAEFHDALKELGVATEYMVELLTPTHPDAAEALKHIVAGLSGCRSELAEMIGIDTIETLATLPRNLN